MTLADDPSRGVISADVQVEGESQLPDVEQALDLLLKIRLHHPDGSEDRKSLGTRDKKQARALAWVLMLRIQLSRDMPTNTDDDEQKYLERLFRPEQVFSLSQLDLERHFKQIYIGRKLILQYKKLDLANSLLC